MKITNYVTMFDMLAEAPCHDSMFSGHRDESELSKTNGLSFGVHFPLLFHSNNKPVSCLYINIGPQCLLLVIYFLNK